MAFCWPSYITLQKGQTKTRALTPRAFSSASLAPARGPGQVLVRPQHPAAAAVLEAG